MEKKMLTFVYARTTPNGTSSYEVEGLRGSLFITKSMFAGKHPQFLELPAEFFATPKVAKKASAEELQAAADAAVAKAARLSAAAAKLASRAAKLAPKAPAPAPRLIVDPSAITPKSDVSIVLA